MHISTNDNFKNFICKHLSLFPGLNFYSTHVKDISGKNSISEVAFTTIWPYVLHYCFWIAFPIIMVGYKADFGPKGDWHKNEYMCWATLGSNCIVGVAGITSGVCRLICIINLNWRPSLHVYLLLLVEDRVGLHPSFQVLEKWRKLH